MRKHITILTAVIALTLSVVTPAAANPPTRAEFPIPPEGIVLPSNLCGSPGFPILLTALKDNTKVITFVNAQGQPRFSITNGALKLRLTNTNNHRSVDVNASGPGRFDADFSTLNTHGTWLMFFPTPFAGAPSQLFMVTGNAVVDFNASSFQLRGGHTENLCPQLV